MNKAIYFDNNATTHLLTEVKQEIERIIHSEYGNPSSPHSQADFGRQLIESARNSVASLLSTSSDRILFTSCGSESNSMVFNTVLNGKSFSPSCIISTSVEHSSIKNSVAYCKYKGLPVVTLPVDEYGKINLGELEHYLKRADSPFVSIGWANNETGVLQSIQEIATLVHRYNGLLHTDAAQLVGKESVDLHDVDVDFLSFSGHKLHAPKGVGGLYVKNKKMLLPLIIGGSQEWGLRGGTENLIGIGALGKAAALRRDALKESIGKMKELRDTFEKALLSEIVDVKINGIGVERNANTSNICFVNIDGRALVARLDMNGVYCSQTSACTSQIPEPSQVLTQMGLSEEEAFSSVRFSFAVDNEIHEIYEAVRVIKEVVESLRAFNKQYL